MTKIIINLLSAFFTIYTVFLFYSIYGRAKLSRIQNAGMIASLSAVVFLILMLTDGGMLRLLGITGSIFVVSFFFTMKWLSRILCWSVHCAISIAVEAVAAAGISALLSIDMANSKEGLFYILGVLLSKFLILLITIVLRLKKNFKIYGITAGKLLLIMLVPLSTLSLMLLQYFFEKSVSENVMLMLTLAYTLLILSNIAVFEYIDSICDNAVKEGKISTAAQIIDSQIKQMETVAQNQKDIIRLQHDQKNAYVGMVKELQNGNIAAVIDEMNKYIDILQKKGEESPDIIDTVVKFKRELAAKKNITLCFEYQASTELCIPAIDMAVILGNALDNAIESTEKVQDDPRNIDVLIAIRNMNVVIVINNPVAKDVDVDKLITDKDDSRFHGYGILSMQQIAANYGGEICFSLEDRMFETCIILQNVNRRKEN